MRRRGGVLSGALVAVVILTTLSGVAHANGLPSDVIMTGSGAVLLPRSGSPLHVERADIVVNVSRRPAAIQATYLITNAGRKDSTERIAFFTPNREGVSALDVTIAGRRVEAVPLRGDAREFVPPGFVPAPDDSWLDPTTGALYTPAAKPWSRNEGAAVFVFPVQIQAGETCVVEVKYAQEASVDYGRLVGPVYRYDYHLWPARHWPAFGPIAITIVSGSEQKAVMTNLRGPARREGHRVVYGAEHAGVPADVLSVYVYNGPLVHWLPRPLAAFWAHRWGRVAAVAAGCLAAGVCGGLIGRAGRRGKGLAGLALSLLGLWWGYRNLPLSGSGPTWAIAMIFLFFPALVLATLAVCHLAGTAKSPRRTRPSGPRTPGG